MASFDVSAAARGFARPTLSFELMPPRNPDAAPKFWNAARKLVEAHPDFISVTYGAAGNDRNTARTVVERLVKHTNVLPIAHLTCVGATRDNVADTIDDFLSIGARTFLALRGDPPRDQPDWQPPADGVHSSAELIELIREVETKRCHADAPAALRGAAKPLTIAVATFCEGNRDAGTTREQEVLRLLEKQEAGAHFAITQLFYEADSYTQFVELARREGVTIPILAGILPTTDPNRRSAPRPRIHREPSPAPLTWNRSVRGTGSGSARGRGPRPAHLHLQQIRARTRSARRPTTRQSARTQRFRPDHGSTGRGASRLPVIV
jgi:methylenetetrahydrofolate reductase (NADPH)